MVGVFAEKAYFSGRPGGDG